MKLRGLLFLFLLPFIFMGIQGCDTCTDSGEIFLDAEHQNVSVSYVTTGGVPVEPNPSNTVISVNTNGGVGGYSIVSDVPVGAGKIGPINFTRLSSDPAVMGKIYDHWYLIQMDTTVSDTLRIHFIPTADECSEFFQVLDYYRNGVLQTESGNEIASFTWVE